MVVRRLVAVCLAPSKPTRSTRRRTRCCASSATTEGVRGRQPAASSPVGLEGEVPQRVAERLASTGPPDELINRLDGHPQHRAQHRRHVRHAEHRRRSRALVNTFAEQPLALHRRAQRSRREPRRRPQAERARRPRSQDLERQIIAAGGEPRQVDVAAWPARPGLDGSASVDTEAHGDVTEWDVAAGARPSAKQGRRRPSAPRRASACCWRASSSLLLGFGVAIMLDRSDSRLHTKEQAERAVRPAGAGRGPAAVDPQPAPRRGVRLRARRRPGRGVPGAAHRAAAVPRPAAPRGRDRRPARPAAARQGGRRRRPARSSWSPRPRPATARAPRPPTWPWPTPSRASRSCSSTGTCGGPSRPGCSTPRTRPASASSSRPATPRWCDYVHSTSVPGLHLVPAGQARPPARRPARRRAAPAGRGPQPGRRRHHRHRTAAGGQRHP